MIRHPDKKMMKPLQVLWTSCFGDTPQYTAFLFENLLEPANVLAYTDGEDNPAAMLCWQQFSMRTQLGQAVPGAYIFGVATHPDYRGRGLSTALLDEAHRVLQKRGIQVSALVPASEGLFGFYGKRGYKTAFNLRKTLVHAKLVGGAQAPCILTPRPLDKLVSLRRAAFEGCSLFVDWPGEYLHYIGTECTTFGGESLHIACGTGEGYAVCYPWEKRVYVKELVLGQDGLDSFLSALHRRYGAEEYVLYLREDFLSGYMDTVLPFAMVKWYDKGSDLDRQLFPGAPAYIAHVLD